MKVLKFSVLICIFLINVHIIYGHTHSHGDHGHSHGDHGHSHGDHGHSHGSHGHSHGDHGHSHGHDDHGHSHEHKHSHLDSIAHGHGGPHGHSHDHADEAPHFKYSKEANSPHMAPEKTNKLQHNVEAKVTEHVTSSTERNSVGELWIPSLISTAIVSVAPILILLFIPLGNNAEDQPFLKVLLSFASGGLLGDAFLHLIPHALFPHNHHGHSHSSETEFHHEHSHDDHDHHNHHHDMSVPLWVLAGILAFLIVEKIVRYVKQGEGHGHSHASKSHSHHKGKEQDEKKGEKSKNDENDKDKANKSEGDVAAPKKDSSPKKEPEAVENTNEIKVSGYLNLVADFSHNFTDGLAIGASFMVNYNVGIITTVTILFHELPHEIGDFAILVQSGYSKRKAMGMQVLTGVGAMCGTICSLMAEGLGDAAIAWILPFTAGGFIYIATVSVIPELLESSSPWQSVKEILALLTGVAMMVVIGQME